MDNTIALQLRASIKKHEGFRRHGYRDSKGILTIGYGRNLEAIGISETEADIMLNDDIVNATAELYQFLPWTQQLDDARKAVLIEMTFNMGIEKLLTFNVGPDCFLAKVKEGKWEEAEQHGLNSLWAKEVGNRADDLMHVLVKGSFN